MNGALNNLRLSLKQNYGDVHTIENRPAVKAIDGDVDKNDDPSS